MKRVVLLSVVMSLACGGDDGASGGDQAAPAVAPLGTGTITGFVQFSGMAPANPAIDMAEEPDCKAKHSNGPVDPRVAVSDGRLGGAFVYVKGGLPAGPYPAAPTAVLDQNGCLYNPRVFGVMAGQEFEIRNSDPVLHNIKAVPAANRGFNISQPSEGMVSKRTFNALEIGIPLECSVHGWMNAHVSVVEHPYFSTSGSNGSFSIGGLPAGTYELEAWHPVLGAQTATVTVGDDGAGTAEFTFSS